MKPALQLKIGQNLTLTPQLRQAIRLLQLSSAELEAEIAAALESNPLLEQPEEPAPEEHALPEASQADAGDAADATDDLLDIPDWAQEYQSDSYAAGSGGEDDERERAFADAGLGLQHRLLWQLTLPPMSPPRGRTGRDRDGGASHPALRSARRGRAHAVRMPPGAALPGRCDACRGPGPAHRE